MLKALGLVGLISLSLVFGVIVLVVSRMSGSDFPVQYATGTSIEVLATMLALNAATVVFLVGSLLNIEERAGRPGAFDSTRREAQHNLLVMAGLFLLNVLFVACIAENDHPLINDILTVKQMFAGLVLAVQFIYIVLLIEVITGTFSLKALTTKNKSK